MSRETAIRFMKILAAAKIRLACREGPAAAEAADYYDLVWVAREVGQDMRNRARSLIRAGADPALFGEFAR